MNGRTLVATAGAACLAAAVAGTVGAQQAPEGGIAHIGVVVRDVEASAAAYAALAGTPAPVIREEVEDGEAVRTARMRLANVDVELIQPAGAGGGAFRAYLDTRGQGVRHLAVRTGGAGGQVDLTDSLGLVVEIVGPETDAGTDRTARAGGDLDHRACITHLGIAVRDIRAARRALLDLLGVEPRPIREFQAARGRGEFTAFNLRNVSIELLQQIGDGGGTYTDFLELHGPRVHHVGMHFRNAGGSLDMQQQNARLERHGGVLAADGGSHAYFDLRPRLGLLVETLAPASSDAIYPHPHAEP